MEQITSEQIKSNYHAMLSSVDLINSYVTSCPENLNVLEQKDAVDRNVRHLEIMLLKDYWTTEDMTSIELAIVTGKVFFRSIT